MANLKTKLYIWVPCIINAIVPSQAVFLLPWLRKKAARGGLGMRLLKEVSPTMEYWSAYSSRCLCAFFYREHMHGPTSVTDLDE